MIEVPKTSKELRQEALHYQNLLNSSIWLDKYTEEELAQIWEKYNQVINQLGGQNEQRSSITSR
jgi:hypothetical protein